MIKNQKVREVITLNGGKVSDNLIKYARKHKLLLRFKGTNSTLEYVKKTFEDVTYRNEDTDDVFYTLSKDPTIEIGSLLELTVLNTSILHAIHDNEKHKCKLYGNFDYRVKTCTKMEVL